MKKLLIVFLLTSFVTTAQDVHFPTDEYGIVTFGIDPMGSIAEKSINFNAGIGLVSYWKYVNFNIQAFPALEGGYFDFAGSFGINLTAGKFERWRGYTGLRLGLINRAKYLYPLHGFEAGLDYKIKNTNLYVGARTWYDYRSDFKFSGAEPEYQINGDVHFGFTF